MASEILINVGVGEIRVALVVDRRLEDYSFERILGGGHRSRTGDIILGRVQRVVPGMQAAFVEIGAAKAGFLALREALPLAGTKDETAGISDCVREGEAILVQIIKDPIGEKGARLSADITLPGRFLVMTPCQPGLAVSRRIEDEAERTRLMQWEHEFLADSRLSPDAGFIFRTAAQGASRAELTEDALALNLLWRDIDAKRRTARPPANLHREFGLMERTLRDAVRGDVARVLVDNQGAAEAARNYCRRALPDAAAKIEYVSENLFERHALEDEIARLFQPRVPLASGGWITIEATEALTAIDVNSGSYADAAGLEETGFAVNLEAAREIGRQIRLRGIGGLIVADFIQMVLEEHRAAVLEALTESLEFDRAPLQLSAMSEFGIVAITRKRVRESLAQLTCEPCAVCEGIGHRSTAETVAQKILRRIEAEARAWPGRELVVTAAPSVAAWLEQQGAAQVLVERGVARVRFQAVANGLEAFDVAPG